MCAVPYCACSSSLVELLNIQSPFLEAFLKREEQYVDMLCNYYIRNKKFGVAGECAIISSTQWSSTRDG